MNKESTLNPLIEKANFYYDEKLFLVRCPSCHLENYGPAVASERCAWCEWTETIKEDKHE